MLPVRTIGVVLAVLLVGYICMLLFLAPLLPLQDLPNHLARAAVMADLIFEHGREFAQFYTFHFLAASYVAGDLFLAALVEVLGVSRSEGLWAVLVFLSLPLALFTYMRAMRAPRDSTLLLLLLSLYLSTDTFFVLGFLSFRLAVAFVLVALALAESLRREWSALRYAGFIAIIALAYFTHFAAIVFTAAALGISGLLRIQRGASRVVREAYLLLPVGCALVWQMVFAAHYRRPGDIVNDAYYWGTAVNKVIRLPWELFRYNSHHWDALLVLLLAASLGFWVKGASIRPALRNPQVIEPLALSVTFLAMFLILPSVYSEASFVDVRALALTLIFLIIGVLNLPGRPRPPAARGPVLAIASACLLALINLAYLGKHMRAESRFMGQYRAIVASIPEHGRVLPIYTGHKDGTANPYLHLAAFAVIDRGVMIPYLFSGDTGAPMKYFRYVHLPYAPEETWYHSHTAPEPDWKQVPGNYQYLLVMKPFDASRIPVATRPIAENAAAVLLFLE
jgi:hypothetical protein